MNVQEIKAKYCIDETKQKVDEIVVYYNGKLVGQKPVLAIPGAKPKDYVNEKEARQFARTFKMWDAVGYKNAILYSFRPTYSDLKKQGRA